MKILPKCVMAAVAALLASAAAQAQDRAAYEGMVAKHAKANGVPEALVHRVIVRESKYRPELVGRGGTIGLMQIKLATARGVGYTGDAAGLHDPDTNLAYGVKYLAGAYRAAERDHDRTVRYFASGYYYVAKRQRLERQQAAPVLASATAKPVETAAEAAPEKQEEKEVPVADTKPAAAAPAARPAAARPSGKPLDLVPPVHAAATKPARLKSSRKLAEAKTVETKTVETKTVETKTAVPRPPATVPAGAKGAKPR